MKKVAWILVSLFALMALVLPGCSDNGTNNTTTTTGVTTIIVATDATFPPMESINTQKQIEGFDIDLLNAIGDKEGIKFEFKDTPWDTLLSGMAQGTFDVAISSITITDARKQQMMFSDPYFTAGQTIAVKKDNTSINGEADLTGKKIGTQLGTTGDILAKGISGATVKPYDDIGLAFQDLMNGQVDAVIVDTPIANSYVKKNSTALKTVGAALSTEDYGIAVAKGKNDILNKINDGLAKVKADGTYDRLIAKWFPA